MKRNTTIEAGTPESEAPAKQARTNDPVERAARQLRQQLAKALQQRNDDLAEHTRKIVRLEEALERLTATAAPAAAAEDES